MLDELQRAKPASAKGRYLKKISVSSTMGPGVKIDPNRLKPETTSRLTGRSPGGRPAPTVGRRRTTCTLAEDLRCALGR